VNVWLSPLSGSLLGATTLAPVTGPVLGAVAPLAGTIGGGSMLPPPSGPGGTGGLTMSIPLGAHAGSFPASGKRFE
jgi:hypothetical protein